ncbi:MAG: hypothetical protein KJO07_22015 [Deltaproteobacteria bacterium]|nr:hypothetical protein [Deltaproteobacteria bacterium]
MTDALQKTSAPGPLALDPSLVPAVADAPQPRWQRHAWWVCLLSWGVHYLSESFWVDLASFVVMMGCFFVLLPPIRLVPWLRGRRWAKERKQLLNGAGYAALIEGQEQEVRTLEARGQAAQVRLEALYELGYACLRSGQSRRALAIFSELHQLFDDHAAPWGKEESLPLHMAMAYLSAGDLPAAQAWLGDSSADPARIGVLATGGKFEEAASSFYRPNVWVPFDWLAHDKRVFALIRAYARHQRGQDPSPDDLQKARPQSALEYGYLTQSWPELSDYIQRAGIEPTGKAALLPAARALSKSAG